MTAAKENAPRASDGPEGKGGVTVPSLRVSADESAATPDAADLLVHVVGGLALKDHESQPVPGWGTWATLVRIFFSDPRLVTENLIEKKEEPGKFEKPADAKLFCLAELRENRRDEAHFLGTNVGTWDFDPKTPEEVLTTADACAALSGHSAVYYSSFNNGWRDLPRFRIHVPLSRAVSYAEYKKVWKHVNATLFAGKGDKQAATGVHKWFYPMAHSGNEKYPGNAARYERGAQDGKPLDVDRILTEAATVRPKAALPGPRPVNDLSEDEARADRYRAFAKRVAIRWPRVGERHFAKMKLAGALMNDGRNDAEILAIYHALSVELHGESRADAEKAKFQSNELRTTRALHDAGSHHTGWPQFRELIDDNDLLDSANACLEGPGPRVGCNLLKASTAGALEDVEPPANDVASPTIDKFERGDQLELAEALLATHRDLVHAENAWWRYNAARGMWGDDCVEQHLIQTVHSFGRVPCAAKKGQARGMSAADVRGVLELAQQKAAVPEYFTAPRAGVAFTNGFVTIEVGGHLTTIPHAPDHRARFGYGFEFDASLRASIWEAFLESLFRGDPDATQKIGMLQEFFGACLFGVAPRFQRCVFLSGGGSNGKSTLLGAIQRVFPAGRVSTLSPQDFGDKFRPAGLVGKLLNVTSETPKDAIVVSENFKAAISGDPFEVERKHEHPFQLAAVAGHVFSCNELPRVVDHSLGFWRRLVVIGFNRNFDGADIGDRDRDLPEKLAAEQRGIAVWLVNGAVRLLARGDYVLPPSHAELTAQWRDESDNVLMFVRERTEPAGTAAGTPTALLYAEYRSWGVASGFQPVSMTAFGKRLTVLGYDAEKGRSARMRPLRLVAYGAGAAA